ncbi:MAG: V-type ATP synthase subunit F [Defluviitaleaceae bacterium]|nr:V-type ATP synthase subunit F [Defluviitaleaceae bacterium]
MKIYVISDNQATITGLGLASVHGHIVHTSEELNQAIETACPDAGLILITEGIARKSKDILNCFYPKKHLPLVSIIPDL